MDALRWLLSLVRLIDVVEVGLVAFLLYRLYRLMQGTIAVQIFFGVLALLGIQAIVAALDLTILRAFFDAFSSVFAIAIVVLFQPELRRLLLLVGQNPLVRRIVTNVQAGRADTLDTLDALSDAVGTMSRKRMGALIALERTVGLRSYIETGTRLGAHLDADLLVTLFYGQNPLHDGAVVVRGDVIEAARCILPVTQQDLDPHLGLRHRAAVGLTEQTDAVAIVVSEETGTVSVAVGGVLQRFPGGDGFRRYLDDVLGARVERPDAVA